MKYLMELSPELVRRKEDLNRELLRSIEGESRLAHVNHRLSVTLMNIALGCSVAAAIIGIFFNVSPKIVGGIAVLPPLIAYIAVNLKLEGKSSWHYRKREALSALRSRLLYQQPEVPSADNIAAIAKSWEELNLKMREEWDRSLTLNWSGIQNQK